MSKLELHNTTPGTFYYNIYNISVYSARISRPVFKNKMKAKKLKPLKPLKTIAKIKKKRKKRPITKETVGTSKLEKKFGEFMNSIGIEFDTQFQLSWKFYDFIIKDTNIVVEMDGDFWHCNPAVYKNGPINSQQKKAKKNDKLKNHLAEVAGYDLVRIWEKDFKDNQDMVKELLLKKLEKYHEKKKNK